MSDGQNDATPLSRLVERPFEYDFVQAVRLLEDYGGNGHPQGHPVGYDNAPENEAVRFLVSPSLRNSSSQIVGVRLAEDDNNIYELTVPFIGMVGANGVLPRHYSQAVISRIKQHDYAMLDFLDLFHHRIISMFFRASVKYRLPYVYQSIQNRSTSSDDSITQALRCLVGLGNPGLKRQLSIPDNNFLYYGGHYADDKPTGHSLERIVQDFIGLPAKILQFQFEWLYIDPSEQSSLSSAANNNCLGWDVVIGERVPSMQNRFRVRVGPVRWPEFVELLPRSVQVKQLADLVRVYVGVSLDFDLQVAVEGREIPKLVFSETQPPQLGWTTWLFSDPLEAVVDDAVFDISSFGPR